MKLVACFVSAIIASAIGAAVIKLSDGRPYRISGREVFAFAVAVIIWTTALWLGISEVR